MEKAIQQRYVVLILVFALSYINVFSAAAAGFSDPQGVFHFELLDGWIYQVAASEPNLLVFYGPGDDQILYIEYFPCINIQNPIQFAAVALQHYSADYGLPEFKISSVLHTRILAGREVGEVEYSYRGKKERIERRIFAVVGSMGLTITFSDVPASYHEMIDQFERMLDSWLWEVPY